MATRFMAVGSGLLFVISGFLWGSGQTQWLGAPTVLLLVVFSFYLQGKPSLKTYAFTVWVFVFVAAAMFYPFLFLAWGNFELKRLINPLVQIIMFGMGTTLSIKDFQRIFAQPKPVLIGILLQFIIMPLLGFTLAHTFGFEPAIAAGVILIGTCPSGVASNVMTYLAKGNVALSVTITGSTTLLSPVLTPLLMQWLAGAYVRIEVYEMMMNIIAIIIVPTVAGLIVNHLLNRFRLQGPWMEKVLSFSAMASICFILAIIAAMSRDKLLHVGFLLILAVMIHNGLGYLLGYWGARITGLEESACRAVAIEVGLQNGGMASSLAVNVLKSSDAALAAAIFGTWMNISGSILASWWRRRPAR